MKRIIVLMNCAVVLVGISGIAAEAQEGVTLSLDLFYTDDTGDGTPDVYSNGTWQLFALAEGEGLAALDVSISGMVGPWGNVFTAPTPAFKLAFAGGSVPYDVDQDADFSTLDMLFTQVPVLAPGPQDLQYDVGKLGGSTPYVDVLGEFVDTSGTSMTDAVLLAHGTFGSGSTPVINTSELLSSANVFTVEGTAADPPPNGSIVAASPFNTQVRTNLAALAGDISLDGVFVDAYDFGIFAADFDGGVSTDNVWQDGDLNGDKRIDAADAAAMFISWTGDHPPAGAGSVTGHYNPTTGEIEVSINGVVNWYVEYVGGSVMTGDSPVGLNPALGLITDNDVRIGQSGFAPIAYDLNLGNVAASGVPSDGNLQIFWNASLGGELQSALVIIVPEPASVFLAGMGILCLLAGRRRRV